MIISGIISLFLNENEKYLQIINEIFDFPDFKDRENIGKIVEKYLTKLETSTLKNENSFSMKNEIIKLNKLKILDLVLSPFQINHEVVKMSSNRVEVVNFEIIEKKDLE